MHSERMAVCFGKWDGNFCCNWEFCNWELGLFFGDPFVKLRVIRIVFHELYLL